MAYQAVPKGQEFDPFAGFAPTQSHELLSFGPTTPLNKQPRPEPSTQRKRSPTWRNLWKTLATMVGLFLAACIFALLHLGLFLYLDKNRADGPGSFAQSYVAAVSHLLGLLFRATLCASLVVAFTQNLWYLFRQKAMKISNIETLFKITQNPFLLLNPEVVQVAPILFTLAAFTWLLPLAVTFPPGALVVVSNPVQNISSMTVPTYNGSFLGNNSWDDAELHSLAIRFLSSGTWVFQGPTPSVRRLGRLVLELDSITPMDSPCGLNCTYSTQFEGPYFQCTNEISNQSLAPIGTLNCGYNAFTAKNLSNTKPSGGFDFNAPFNMTATRGIHFNNDTQEPRIIQEIETLSCMPSWADYKVNVSYIDGVQTITRSEKYMGSISDLMVPIDNYYPVNGVWSEGVVQWMTGLNHYALLNALVDPLSGNYTMMQQGQFWDGGSSVVFCGATDGLIIADTHFNTQRDNLFRTLHDGPSFSISQEVLNDALFNLTMSASFQLGFWETKVSGSISATHQFYSFESPITLVVPYGSCLVISIPFIVIGLMSLRSNGVSAIEGGFVQVLMTTTGSKAIHEAAAPGCMGGEENMPDVLKKMKVRFGELVPNGVGEDGDPTHVRRAGFGTDDEVVPLKRGMGFGNQ